MVISQIPALKAHISFILWELNIWQTKSWHNYPHPQRQFHRFLWNSYFIPTLRAHHLVDQVLAYLPPVNMAIVTDSCSDSSQSWHNWPASSKAISQISFSTLRARHLADQVLADLPPCFWVAILHWFLLWQLLFHSYSESLIIWQTRCWQIYLPIFWVAISLIPALTALISFLLWELIIWLTRSCQM